MLIWDNKGVCMWLGESSVGVYPLRTVEVGSCILLLVLSGVMRGVCEASV